MLKMLLYFIILFFNLFEKYNGIELYFCSKGPQMINLNKCGGGLVFNTPIESKCVGIFSNLQSKTRIHLNASICNEEESVIPELKPTPENSFIQDITFQTAHRSLNSDLLKSKIKKKDKHLNESSALGQCLIECLNDWIDPNLIGGDDEEGIDYGIPPPTEEIQTGQKQLSSDLFYYLSYDYSPETDDNSVSKGDLRILDILHESLTILQKHCSPYVQSEFKSVVHAAHKFILYHTTNELDDLSQRDYSLLLDPLQKCRDNPSKFHIIPYPCGDPQNPKIKSINGERSKLESKSYRWGLFDFLVEAAYSALEFVHGYCYVEYLDNLTYHHILIQSLQNLFSTEIQERWMYPLKFGSDQFWNNIVGVKDINSTMRNIEACIIGSRKFSPYKGRLTRPFEKQPGTFQSSGYGGVSSKNGNPNEIKGRGYSGSLNKYWSEYELNGGIEGGISGIGVCTKDRIEYEEQVRIATGHCANNQNRDGDSDDENGDSRNEYEYEEDENTV